MVLIKLLVFIFLFLILAFSLIEQSSINLPDADDKKIHFGFSLGIHGSGFRIKHTDNFVTSALDSLQSIQNIDKIGFSIGPIVNFRLARYFDLRIMFPKVGFNEYSIAYTFTDGRKKNILIESVTVEFPTLIKYKSVRRGNIRMYMIGGLNPSISPGKKNKQKSEETLSTKHTNLALEYGFGFDFYYPLFKFSPEIRFSRGLKNILGEENDFSAGIQSLATHSVSLYLIFSH